GAFVTSSFYEPLTNMENVAIERVEEGEEAEGGIMKRMENQLMKRLQTRRISPVHESSAQDSVKDNDEYQKNEAKDDEDAKVTSGDEERKEEDDRIAAADISLPSTSSLQDTTLPSTTGDKAMDESMGEMNELGRITPLEDEEATDGKEEEGIRKGSGRIIEESTGFVDEGIDDTTEGMVDKDKDDAGTSSSVEVVVEEIVDEAIEEEKEDEKEDDDTSEEKDKKMDETTDAIEEKIESRVDEVMRLLKAGWVEKGNKVDEERELDEIDREAEELANTMRGEGGADFRIDEEEMMEKEGNREEDKGTMEGEANDKAVIDDLNDEVLEGSEKVDPPVEQKEETMQAEEEEIETEMPMSETGGGITTGNEETDDNLIDQPEEIVDDGGEKKGDDKSPEEIETPEEVVEKEQEMKQESTLADAQSDGIPIAEVADNDATLKKTGDDEKSDPMMETTEDSSVKTDEKEKNEANNDNSTKTVNESTIPAKEEGQNEKSESAVKDSNPIVESEEIAWTMSCICGVKEDNGEKMIMCDMCELRWEHVDCMFPRTKKAPKGRYYCHICKPRPTELTPKEAREYQHKMMKKKEKCGLTEWKKKEIKKTEERSRRAKSNTVDSNSEVSTPYLRSTKKEDHEKTSNDVIEEVKSIADDSKKGNIDSGIDESTRDDVATEDEGPKMQGRVTRRSVRCSKREEKKKITEAAKETTSAATKDDKNTESVAVIEGNGDVRKKLRNKSKAKEKKETISPREESEESGGKDNGKITISANKDEDKSGKVVVKSCEESENEEEEDEEEEENEEKEEDLSAEPVKEREDKITATDLKKIKKFGGEDADLILMANQLMKGTTPRNKRAIESKEDHASPVKSEEPPKKMTRLSASASSATKENPPSEAQSSADNSQASTSTARGEESQPTSTVNTRRSTRAKMSTPSKTLSSTPSKVQPVKEESSKKSTVNTTQSTPSNSGRVTRSRKNGGGTPRPDRTVVEKEVTAPSASEKPSTSQQAKPPLDTSSPSTSSVEKTRKRPISEAGYAIAPLEMDKNFAIPPKGAFCSKIIVAVPQFKALPIRLRPSLDLPLPGIPSVSAADDSLFVEMNQLEVDDFSMVGKLSGAIYFTPREAIQESIVQIGFYYYVWTSNSGRWTRSHFVSAKAEKGKQTRMRFVLQIDKFVYCEESGNSFVLKNNSPIFEEKISVVAVARVDERLMRSQESILDFDKKNASDQTKRSRQ
ncbi:hypothetical protein PMAYCL1PPCAC_28863, partial [Pristionchus mayeri]